MDAIEPPPAPIVRISTIGSRTGSPSTSPCMRWVIAPSATTHTSKLVPPISTPTRFGMPSRPASRCAARAPPDGPDSSSRAGWADAVSGLHTPPLDCTSSSLAVMPCCASRTRNRST